MKLNWRNANDEHPDELDICVVELLDRWERPVWLNVAVWYAGQWYAMDWSHIYEPGVRMAFEWSGIEGVDIHWPHRIMLDLLENTCDTTAIVSRFAVIGNLNDAGQSAPLNRFKKSLEEAGKDESK